MRDFIDKLLSAKDKSPDLEELGEITGINLHRPSDHSPYVWCMLNDKFEDDGDGLVLVICGTKWELSSTYIDTQIH